MKYWEYRIYVGIIFISLIRQEVKRGLIISDEEYKDSCRITLEKCERYYAITCGIYGGMMHTVFCNSTQYQETYNNMKKDLQEFIDKNTSDEEEIEFYGLVYK